jgi:hypothetical protein
MDVRDVNRRRGPIFSMLAGPVWVSEKDREHPTPSQIDRAIWLRRAGLCIVFIVPLAVSYAKVAPVVWHAAYEAGGLAREREEVAEVRDAVPSPHDAPARHARANDSQAVSAAPRVPHAPPLRDLLVALALAALYAWYAWFVTDLLLFAPPLDRIRGQDIVLPGMLAVAYVLYAYSAHRHLLNDGPALSTQIYAYVFLAVYIAWMLRDFRELSETGSKQGNLNAAAGMIRRIWLLVDFVQICAIALPIVVASLKLPGVFQPKDVAVVSAFVGWALVTSINAQFRAASIVTTFREYVRTSDLSDVDWLDRDSLVVDLLQGSQFHVVDVGCAEGRRMTQLIDALDAAEVQRPLSVVGIDNLEEWRGEYEETLRQVALQGRFLLGNCGDVGDELTFEAKVVLHISHFPLRRTGERRAVTGLIKRLIAERKLLAVFWRGPAGHSFTHAISVLGSSDYVVPTHNHLMARAFWRSMEGDMIRIPADRQGPSATINQRTPLDQRNIAAMAEWLAHQVPSRVADRARNWLTQQENQMAIDDDDLHVFVPNYPLAMQ